VLDMMQAALAHVSGSDAQSAPASAVACSAAFTLAQYADTMYRWALAPQQCAACIALAVRCMHQPEMCLLP
jgi:hypothetical protein